jgi:ATP-dependent DNA ligase
MARSILIVEFPRFVPPMLAKPGVPFDSPEHVFEVKWDGTRVLAFVERYGSGIRVRDSGRSRQRGGG